MQEASGAHRFAEWFWVGLLLFAVALYCAFEVGRQADALAANQLKRGLDAIGRSCGLPENKAGLAHESGVGEALRPVSFAGHCVLLMFVLTATATGTCFMQHGYRVMRPGPHDAQRTVSDRQIALMAGGTFDALVVVDAEGYIRQWNGQAERTFGWSADEAVGAKLENLIFPASRQSVACLELDRCLQAEAPSPRRYRTQALHRDGYEVPIEVAVARVQGNESPQWMLFARDLTELTQIENQARQHLAELTHLARLNRATEMVTGLAHELNQPLCAAANYARACTRFLEQNTGASREELLDWMKRSVVQTERAFEIVRRLGDFVRKSGAPRQSFDLNQLVADVMALLAPDIRAAGAAPGTHLDATLAPVRADRVQVEQVLVNLISNALDAMRATDASRRALVVRTERVDASTVKVTVTDAGPGVTPSVMSHLFKPFFTTKQSGMGLGLSISRSIIEAHQGRLWVETTSEKGTSFAFTLMS